jgi:hypothetical protein
MDINQSIDLISIIKHDPSIINLIKNNYPDFKIEQFDNNIIKSFIESLYTESLNDILNKSYDDNYNTKQNINIANNNDTITKTIVKAHTKIPEMLIPVKSIYLNGKLNNKPVKILFDTGATVNCIYKSTAINLGLENIIDNQLVSNINGINGNQTSIGTIWYTEIELNFITSENENTIAFIGLNLVVIDDEKNTDNNFDIIFGMSFMKSYNVNIDFMTQIITLNNKLKIKFL